MTFRAKSMPVITAATFAAAVALAGCNSNPPAVGGSGAGHQMTASMSCNALEAKVAVGKQATAALVNDSRIRSGSQMARVIRPGQMVTKEYVAARLNLAVDDSGVVTAVTCG